LSSKKRNAVSNAWTGLIFATSNRALLIAVSELKQAHHINRLNAKDQGQDSPDLAQTCKAELKQGAALSILY